MKKVDMVCDYKRCLGCGVCKNICPVNAIKMTEATSKGEIHPSIDNQVCLGCGTCIRACPANYISELRQPIVCYAVQHKDEELLSRSASGGFIAAAYQFFLSKNAYIVGVGNGNNTFTYSVSNKEADIAKYQNSKYVQSDTANIYKNVGDLLKKSRKVLFVGLPCHVAGLLLYLREKKIHSNLLITIDLVCHGVVPKKLLLEYLQHITKSNKNVDISFRDPKYGTMRFILSISRNGKEVYHSGVHRRDIYQEGYHGGFFYRDSCYDCPFAQKKRVGDLTVSDFHGYGRVKVGTMQGKKTCVMLNSNKGKQFFTELMQNGAIIAENRPMEEAMNYNKQLNGPVIRSKISQRYSELVQKEATLYKAASKSLRRHCFKNELIHFSNYDKIYEWLSNHLPYNAKQKVKKILKREI